MDAQGQVVGKALNSLGYGEVKAVRIGKLIEVELDGGDLEKARARTDEMCRKLLANPVIENYTIEVE
jgi:phosphoribosylformylglycinamidine synthase PurS subunit